MAHIPPIRPNDPEDRAIKIDSKANTITIVLPKFYEVNTSMSITLSGDGGGVKVLSEAIDENDVDRKFKSRITEIKLKDVQPVSSAKDEFVFKPKNNGDCSIEISFEHLM
jgi:hypothetical protein